MIFYGFLRWVKTARILIMLQNRDNTALPSDVRKVSDLPSMIYVFWATPFIGPRVRRRFINAIVETKPYLAGVSYRTRTRSGRNWLMRDRFFAFPPFRGGGF